MRFLSYLVVLILLSHCATKHSPIEFAPYFASRPESQLSRDQLLEAKALEAKKDLSTLEKKRLADLYAAELRTLKPNSARYIWLTDQWGRLHRDVEGMEHDVAQVQQELRSHAPEEKIDKPGSAFQNPSLRKDYLAAVQLWNRNQAPQALKKIEDIFKAVASGGTTKGERLRLLNLRFRIFIEQGDLNGAGQTYVDMQKEEACDPDTTQAGFLLSLRVLAAGDSKKGLQIFQAQCDQDTSAANILKRKYWLARFHENEPEVAQHLYQEVSREAVPGYLGFLAQVRLGKKIALPQGGLGAPNPPLRPFLGEDLTVPSEVHRCFLEAERLLQANLRRDATIYLIKATRLMKKHSEDFVLPLLYTAHLFQAAGNHLEALRIYAEITNVFMEGENSEAIVGNPLFSDMFPRPFPGKVEWLGRIWNIDPDFVYSIVRQESAFNPGAVSISDARGYMQLMPSLARSLSKQWSFLPYYNDKSLFNAEENLKLGVFHLHQLQELLPHIALMAASYNAGINRVMNWWKYYGTFPLDIFVESIPVTETRNYVKLVMRNYYYYKILRAGGPVDAGLVPFTLGRFPGEYALSDEIGQVLKSERLHPPAVRLD